jgi:hypothetical protein
MLTKLKIKIIKALLWLLDKNHRADQRIHDDVKVFTHTDHHYFGSDFGIGTTAVRTVPYVAWEVTTDTKSLVCADKHRLITAEHTPVYAEDLRVGQMIKTSDGMEIVRSCRNLGIRVHMYCVEIIAAPRPFQNLYFANGILSHNTTTASAYLLWKAMFFDDTKILVAANKLKSALEVMSRIKYAYEECPDYIKAGAKKFNEGSILFDNGSVIEAVATTADAARGKSLTLLYLDEFAFVPNNMATEFWTAVQPTLAEGGACIITSTPRTDEDQFAQIWKGANKNTDEYGNPTGKATGVNDFFPISVPWWEHPHRDEEWAKPFRASLGPARFAQEFECLVGDTQVELDTGPTTIKALFDMLKMSGAASQIDKL